MKEPIFHDAEAGNPYACLGVAYYYHQGKEVDQDFQEAMRWYRRAAFGGCPRAHWELAQIYRDGFLVPQDLGKYVEHMSIAAELGNAEAQFNLGSELSSDILLDKDPEEAFRWFNKAAERGHIFSKFIVGYCYYQGFGTPRSRHDAEIWFSTVSLMGDGDLFMEIGLSYEYGLNGITHNEVEAGRWYKYGTEMGHEKCTLCWNAVMSHLAGGPKESLDDRLVRLDNTEAQREIHLMEQMIEEGDTAMSEGDAERALESYTAAADLGSPEAMFIVAMMYHQGIDVKRNDSMAMDLLRRASAAGSEDAEFLLGRLYDLGYLPRDETAAVEYYAKAAANGFLAAFYYLGRFMDHPEVYVRNTSRR